MTRSRSLGVLRSTRGSLQLFSFGPNIAQVKASESSISEERNKPGAMTRETETENLDSADRGLTADVVFQGVAFEHFGSMTPTFVHSNLTIASGSFVASADASRGGKSTTISLLEPFDKPFEGTILFGGRKNAVSKWHITAESRL
ncbi:uncharacterized protein BO88DRAFT_457001 [Aspergillus vadensis CBS 113365]|uniref:ABC transporter domain-containing protein n=1 Tax=Aspergillus vadensis (strain CBS 113365 / IMI 142717 / IBT 24658) TaxID=1448311 RepID=A0A319BJ40_ASPVC|nr:hypothetical protein BO88DRAFT_457001 [Aspergillus vadensis CBS 113365]PYH65773.1 hypothetical protein BO88DRAFT_457001 [Aspergillus vadensis CBS 113365]